MNDSKKASRGETESFEKTLKKIESIVEEIESGKLPLNDIVNKFKECTELIAKCRKMLGNVQQEIQVLEAQLDKEKSK